MTNPKSQRGKLIVIEGTDGTGKKTQSELLYRRLKQRGLKAAILHIPIYESFTGELVARYLRNEFGRIDPHLAALLYAVNRFQFRGKIVNWLVEGRVVVLNRYVTANQIHQAAHLGASKGRVDFQNWVAELEYKIFGMPKPDLILFMNVPVEIAIRMVDGKSQKDRKYAYGSKEDLLESDLEHQRQALKEAMRLAKRERNGHVINAATKDRMLPKQEIADKIWAIARRVVKR